MAIQSVTLNYQGHYGYLDYNEETHEMTVFIPDAEEAANQIPPVLGRIDQRAGLSGDDFLGRSLRISARTISEK